MRKKIHKKKQNFLIATFRMLSDKDNENIVRWSEDGNSFIIVD